MKHDRILPALLLCALGTAACNSEPSEPTTQGAQSTSVEQASFKVSGLT